MSKKRRRPYQPPEPARLHEKLRKEWVELDGGDVCVWEMRAPEMLSLGERSQRPGIDPRGGVDVTSAALLLTAFCTHVDDLPGSPRVWDDLQLGQINLLRSEEFTRLQEAIQRVNGTSPAAIEAVRDFTLATGAPNTSDSPSSASSNSTGSPVSSRECSTTS